MYAELVGESNSVPIFRCWCWGKHSTMAISGPFYQNHLKNGKGSPLSSSNQTLTSTDTHTTIISTDPPLNFTKTLENSAENQLTCTAIPLSSTGKTSCFIEQQSNSTDTPLLKSDPTTITGGLNKIENVNTNLQETADQQRGKTNNNNFNIRNGGDKFMTAKLPPPQFSPAPSSTSTQSSGKQQQQHQPLNSNGQSQLPDLAQPLSSPPTNQPDHMQRLQQCQQSQGQILGSRHVGRPCVIRFIGWIDIISVVLFTALEVYNFKSSPYSLSDPDSHLQFFFVGILPILTRLMMGFALLAGLRSSDDSTTLFYCKIWIVCQLPFLLYSVFEIIRSIILHANASKSRSAMTSYRSTPNELLVTLLLNVGIFVYRIICLITVQLFVNKLKRSEAETLMAINAYLERQHQGRTCYCEQVEQENRNEFAARENAMCEPTVAMLLAM